MGTVFWELKESVTADFLSTLLHSANFLPNILPYLLTDLCNFNVATYWAVVCHTGFWLQINSWSVNIRINLLWNVDLLQMYISNVVTRLNNRSMFGVDWENIGRFFIIWRTVSSWLFLVGRITKSWYTGVHTTLLSYFRLELVIFSNRDLCQE